ncbi:MAG: hypothetical protein N2V75_08155 [Methanophagales archaeon]|nr:hypothetical protein [Methanophagales archaeon]
MKQIDISYTEYSGKPETPNPFTTYEIIPPIEVNIIIAVPTALCILNFNATTITGTITTPPPIPISPQKNPRGSPHNNKAADFQVDALRFLEV